MNYVKYISDIYWPTLSRSIQINSTLPDTLRIIYIISFSSVVLLGLNKFTNLLQIKSIHNVYYISLCNSVLQLYDGSGSICKFDTKNKIIKSWKVNNIFNRKSDFSGRSFKCLIKPLGNFLRNSKILRIYIILTGVPQGILFCIYYIYTTKSKIKLIKSFHQFKQNT